MVVMVLGVEYEFSCFFLYYFYGVNLCVVWCIGFILLNLYFEDGYGLIIVL